MISRILKTFALRSLELPSINPVILLIFVSISKEEVFSVTLGEHEPWIGIREVINIAGEKVSLSTLINVLCNFLKEGLCWQNAVASAPLTCWNGRFLASQHVSVSEVAVFVRDTMRDSVLKYLACSNSCGYPGRIWLTLLAAARLAPDVSLVSNPNV